MRETRHPCLAVVRLGGAAVLGLVLAGPALAGTLLVDFEHYPGPDGRLLTSDDVPTPTCPVPLSPAVNLTTEYASVGLTFSSGTLFCGGTSFWPGHEHFLSSSPLDATLSIPVHGISITSYSYWTATLTAYDAANNVLATDVFGGTGTGPTLGTLTVSTSVPIARFTVRADTINLILNLDDLVLTLKSLDFFTVTPCRLIDTRDPNGPRADPVLRGGLARTFSLAGACGLPTTAWAVAVNVTVVDPTLPGDLRLYPGDISAPLASTLNFGAGQTRANLVVLSVGRGGTAAVLSSQAPSGSTQVLVDLVGYFE
jgi:hypothetical protein